MDLSFLLGNLNIIESDYMFNSDTIMFDPVKDAIGDNVTPTSGNSNGGRVTGTPWGDPLGGPDRKPLGDCSVLDNQETIKL